MAASPGSENASSRAATSSGSASPVCGAPELSGPLSGTRGSLTLTLMGPLRAGWAGAGAARFGGGGPALPTVSSMSPKMSSEVSSPSVSLDGAVAAGLSLPLPELMKL